MVFSRQEYSSGLPFSTLGNLPDPGIKPVSLALQVNSLLPEPLGMPKMERYTAIKKSELLIHATTWLAFSDIMLSVRSPRLILTSDSIYMKFKNRKADL